jgi:hypothetical protein
MRSISVHLKATFAREDIVLERLPYGIVETAFSRKGAIENFASNSMGSIIITN